MALLKSKSPKESAVEMTETVLPGDTNPLGTIFGGRVMQWIDIAAAVCAGRHCRKAVVTASIDSLHFLSPIKQGYIVLLHARVTYVHRTSMEVEVKVESEHPLTGEKRLTAVAHLTYVALDDRGQPTEAPQLKLVTEEEKRASVLAEKRREFRLALAKEAKNLKN